MKFLYKLLKPQVIVLSASDWIKIRAITYSFHARTKEKIATVASPGVEIGKIMRKNEPNWLQPSIIADSSISNGTESKKPLRSQMQNASDDVE